MAEYIVELVAFLAGVSDADLVAGYGEAVNAYQAEVDRLESRYAASLTPAGVALHAVDAALSARHLVPA